jgi:hypothetical protein
MNTNLSSLSSPVLGFFPLAIFVVALKEIQVGNQAVLLMLKSRYTIMGCILYIHRSLQNQSESYYGTQIVLRDLVVIQYL